MGQLSFFNVDSITKSIIMPKVNTIEVNPTASKDRTRKTKQDVVHWLVSVPSSDGNWICAANNASMDELNEALSQLIVLNAAGIGYKSKLVGVQRKINKRKKENL